MLPRLICKAAENHPIEVQTKDGETYTGHLEDSDGWMNLHLREVIRTSKGGDKFWRLSETYIRGNTIRSFRVPSEVGDNVKVKSSAAPEVQSNRGRGRGRGPGRMGDGGRMGVTQQFCSLGITECGRGMSGGRGDCGGRGQF